MCIHQNLYKIYNDYMESIKVDIMNWMCFFSYKANHLNSVVYINILNTFMYVHVFYVCTQRKHCRICAVAVFISCSRVLQATACKFSVVKFHSHRIQ